MNLSEMRQLTTTQYNSTKQRAISEIQSQIGDKPIRKHYVIESGDRWTWRDVVAALIFISALALSTSHILSYVASIVPHFGGGANVETLGISISDQTNTIISQVGFIVLAESSMILMMILHATRSNKPDGWKRFISIPLLIAVMSGIFVIKANLASGMPLFESLFVPIATIGIGTFLEQKAVKSIKQNAETDTRYRQALFVWEQASVNPQEHPNFTDTFGAFLWEKLVSLKANQKYIEASNDFKMNAVLREMNREHWTAGLKNALKPATDTGIVMSTARPVETTEVTSDANPK